MPSWSQSKGSFAVISGLTPGVHAHVVDQTHTSALWVRLRNQNVDVDGKFNLVTFTAPNAL